MFGIDGDLHELLLELGQFVIQIAQGGLREYGWTAGVVLGFGCCVLQPMQVIGNACVHLGGGGMPSAVPSIAARSGVLDQEFGVIEDCVQGAIGSSIIEDTALLMESMQPDRRPQERILGLHDEAPPVNIRKKPAGAGLCPAGQGVRMIGRGDCSGQNRTLNFGWSYADTAPFDQNLIGGSRLAIYPDQIIAGVAAGHLLGKQFTQRCALGDLDLFRETRARVVDVEDLHLDSPEKGSFKMRLEMTAMEFDSCPRQRVEGGTSFLVVEDKTRNAAQAAAIGQAGVGGWGGMLSWEKRV